MLMTGIALFWEFAKFLVAIIAILFGMLIIFYALLLVSTKLIQWGNKQLEEFKEKRENGEDD